MKGLVYITNYEGNKKLIHVNEILNNLELLDVDLDIIIYTTEELNLDTQLSVSVIIKPKVFSNSVWANGWQPEPEFIWLYRADMLSKVNDYDIFIHLEDDISFNKENFNQFIKYSYGEHKLDGYIIGNILFERDGDKKLLPQFHKSYRGLGEIITINGEKFMKPKNLHQASMIISQEQLKLLVDNGFNSTPKLIGGYNIKCSAMTEIYCTKFLTKVIPLNNLDDSLTEHLTGKYVNYRKRTGNHWFNTCQYLDEIKRMLNTMKVKKGNIELKVINTTNKVFWKDYFSGWENSTFDFISKHISKEKTFIDIGAWIGPISLIASFTSKQCICFEPDRIAYEELMENIALNDITNIKVENKAVSIHKEIELGAAVLGMSITRDSCKKNSSVYECISIKEIFDKYELNEANVSMIKIDIEGHEQELLKDKLLWDVNLPMHISLHPNFKEDKDKFFKDIAPFFKHKGIDIFKYKELSGFDITIN